MEDENDLIRRIVHGRADLFEILVKRYQNLVFTICHKITQNRSDAENAAQETFLSAYLSLPSYRGLGFKTWLGRIAANKAIDGKRERDYTRRYEDEFEASEHVAEDGIGLEEWLVKRERNEKLTRVLAALPDKYAAVLQERYYQELPVKEIARLRNLPEKTIETQIYRAKKLVRERWGDNNDF